MSRLRAASAAVLAAALLSGCQTTPAGGSPPPPAEVGASASGVPSSHSEIDLFAPLRPLERQPGVPADAPRSAVPPAADDGTSARGRDDAIAQDDVPLGEPFQRGGASFYGIQFHQRRTANGELFDMGAMTAAHKTLPFNTRVCVRSLVNGREVMVRINDRGPYASGRIIDLSQAAAERLDMVGLGIKQVALTMLPPGSEGRCGAAQQPDPLDVSDARAPAPNRGGRTPSRRKR